VRKSENELTIQISHILMRSSMVNPNPFLMRVTQRTKQGGHDVPTDAIMRRFPRIFINLVNLYLPLADEWRIWDSSETPPKQLANHNSHVISSLSEFFEI
jgi:predicted ABC-type ATPase